MVTTAVREQRILLTVQRTEYSMLGLPALKLTMYISFAAPPPLPCDVVTLSFFLFFFAGELTRTASNFVMSNTTPVSPLALMLLCGNLRAEEVGSSDPAEKATNLL